MLYLLNIQSYQASIRPSQAGFKEIESKCKSAFDELKSDFQDQLVDGMHMQTFISFALRPYSSGSIRRRRANSLDSKALKYIFLNRVKYESF